MAISQRRVALITGGNSGIGFATASKLAAKGFHVILASRNQQTICPSRDDQGVSVAPVDVTSHHAASPEFPSLVYN